MKKWILYVTILGFASYWACNLLLWFPWSYSETLGIVLMLTVTPFIWAYTTYLSLINFPKQELLKPSIIIAFLFLLLATVMDYIFFGLIRGAIEELYHPTTFYGYGFLIAWPLLLALIFRKNISKNKIKLESRDLIKPGVYGIIIFGILTAIILLKIKI